MARVSLISRGLTDFPRSHALSTTVFFKLKHDMKLQKLMRVFCQRQDVAMESVRFLFDGKRIRENQTPNELGMEDGDSIRLVDRLLEKTRDATC
jgi:hypothetical protein